MNGLATVNCPMNEQLIEKFHIMNFGKSPVNTVNNYDDTILWTSLISDESGNTSRCEIICVDRNLGCGR